MSETKGITRVLVFFVIVLILATSALSQDFIVMGTPLVNIRTGPSTDHVIVGRAEKGDIFQVVGRVDGWHRIAMFSGDDRYVFAADYVYELTHESLVPGHRMALTQSDEQLRSIHMDIRKAKERAKKEADEVIPASTAEDRNTNFRKIMQDRIILEVFHIHGLQPALYGQFVEEVGTRNR